MSGKDDPFGSGGKTVISPNPGGAPQARPGRAAAAAVAAAPRQQPSPVLDPPPPHAGAVRQPPPDPNDWIYERRRSARRPAR